MARWVKCLSLKYENQGVCTRTRRKEIADMIAPLGGWVEERKYPEQREGETDGTRPGLGRWGAGENNGNHR